MSASQRVEGRCDLHTVGDETAVEIGHAKESPDLAFGSRDCEIDYCLDFTLEGPYTLVVYLQGSTFPRSPPVRTLLAAGKPHPGVAGTLLHSCWR